MAEHLIVIELTIAAGREEDYRAWHAKHMEEILESVPAVLDARRLEQVEADGAATPADGFVAMYRVDGDPSEATARIQAAGGEGLVSAPPNGVVEAARTRFFDVVEIFDRKE